MGGSGSGVWGRLHNAGGPVGIAGGRGARVCGRWEGRGPECDNTVNPAGEDGNVLCMSS